jgi:NAD(P)-dependent dehydrogenase (short-subunit alcohol dehydrogenase family)
MMPDDTTRYAGLADRVTFVSGGASGIGASLVEHFALQGARVAFCDIDRGAGEALAARIARAARHAPRFLPCDVRDLSELRSCLGQVESELGAVRILVNNAGSDERHALESVTPESWDECLALNLRHHVFAIQRVVPAMAAAGGGSIVNLGSIAWMRGRPHLVGYAAAKAAIFGITRTLARELGERGIRVNSLVPGAILTERQRALRVTPEEERRFVELQCLKLRLEPAHVARAALFLAADDSSGITGQSLIVDAGLGQVSVAG